MSALKNFALVVLAAALLGETWYFSRRVSEDRRQIAAWQKTDAKSREQIRRMKLQGNQAQRPAPSPSTSSADAVPADAMELRMAGILDRIRLLKEWSDRHPGQRIGELAYLTDDDWMETGKRFEHLETEDDFRKAVADLRKQAKTDFMRGPMCKALSAYLKTSGGILPSDVGQLAGYLDPSADPSLLQHYAMIAAGSSEAAKNMPIFAFNPQTSTVDEEYDRSMVGIGPGGSWGDGGGKTTDPEFLLDKMQAANAYRMANSGQQPPTPEQIIPFFKNSQFGAQYLAKLHQGK